MSLHFRSSYGVPEETARVARAAFPKGNLYMQMHEELGALYNNKMRPSKGRGGVRDRPKLRIPAPEYSIEIAIEHFRAGL